MLVVKTVLPQLAGQEYLARFRDEAKIVVQLNHDNLVPVFDAGEIDNKLFLAMDFVEGRDLRAVWNRCAQKSVAFPVDVAVYICREICRGLDYAHQFEKLSLVHRDVSPPNILMSFSGGIKLTDFGLALSSMKMEKTAPGVVYGKISYMSPEQAKGEKLDGRSDQYALAIILWELLTGKQLFPAGSEKNRDLLERAKSPEVLAPSNVARRVPASLDKILLKALEPKRENRYLTCGHFRDALTKWMATHAATTDATSVERFLRRIFVDDMMRDKRKRNDLLKEIDKHTKSSSTNDELKELFVSWSEKQFKDLEASTERRRQPGASGSDTAKRPLQEKRLAQERRGVTGGRRSIDKKMRTVMTSPKHLPTQIAQQDGNGRISPHSNAAGALSLNNNKNSPEHLIGELLDSRYQIESLIGEGGMGKVYQALHVDIGRLVAVKVLHPMYSQMPELVERFRREARAASRIGHPNIVEVTDSGTTSRGAVFFVMELLDGIELAEVIEREETLDSKRALNIGVQICQALAAAHAGDIVHRDLKPENIFLTFNKGSSDFVKVLDFGIAKSAEAEEARDKKLTHPGMAMGTPEYMAPEQAAGKPADRRCDIYSVGAILYEMCSGVPPYSGNNFMEVLSQKATREPVPPIEINPRIDSRINDLILRTMARRPEERPPSMEALEYELMKCISGRGHAVMGVLGFEHDEDFFSGLDESRPEPLVKPEAHVASFPHTSSPEEDKRKVSTSRWPLALGLMCGLLSLTAYWGLFGGSKKTKEADDKTTVTEKIAATPKLKNPIEEKEPVEVQTLPEKTIEPSTEEKKPASNSSLGEVGDVEEPPKKNLPVKISSKEVGKLMRKAKTHKEKLEWSKARDTYLKVVKSGKKRKNAFLGLAEIAFQQKKISETIKYAKLAGHNKKALTLLGHAYYRSKKFDQAMNSYNKVLVLDANYNEARRGLEAAKKKRQ